MSWFSSTDPNFSKPTPHTRSSISDQLAQAQSQSQSQRLAAAHAQYAATGLVAPNYGNNLTAMSTAAGPYLYPLHSYQVVLPPNPRTGDHIVLKYVNGFWKEERSIYAELNPKKDNNSGVFSLDELSHARELIDELSR